MITATLDAALLARERSLANYMLKTRRPELFGELVRDTFSGHPNVSEIRQRGFVAALDLKPSRPGEVWKTNDRTGYRICLEARRHGLLVRPLGDTLLLVPPPAMSVSELRMLCEGTLRAIHQPLP